MDVTSGISRFDEEEFNGQLDRMTHSVDSHPIFPAIPVFAKESMNKEAMVTEMEILLAFSNMQFDS